MLLTSRSFAFDASMLISIWCSCVLQLCVRTCEFEFVSVCEHCSRSFCNKPSELVSNLRALCNANCPFRMRKGRGCCSRRSMGSRREFEFRNNTVQKGVLPKTRARTRSTDRAARITSTSATISKSISSFWSISQERVAHVQLK